MGLTMGQRRRLRRPRRRGTGRRRERVKPRFWTSCAWIAVWHMLHDEVDYQDLGPDHFLNRNPDRARSRAIRQLNQLGYSVTLNPISFAA